VARGRRRGPVGSHDHPASALTMRLSLACFGLVALLAATLMAILWWESAVAAVLFGFGTAVAVLNIYWVAQRIRFERR
jgi:apolipoprotein N-acyltransferase